MKFVYPSGWRVKLDRGSAEFEKLLLPIAERAYMISCAIPLGSDKPNRPGAIYRSIFTSDTWHSSDGIPKNLRNTESWCLSFFDVIMFGTGDIYTDNRKYFWRSISLRRIGPTPSDPEIRMHDAGNLEHLWVSSVEWNHPDFFKLAKPTVSFGPDFTGSSAEKFCRIFHLKIADYNGLKKRHPNYELDYPVQERLQPNGYWKMVGYPVSGFLFTKKADRNSPTPLD